MIKLKADPNNPAQFFGACGFLELASRLAPAVSARWQTGCIEVSGPTNFRQVLELIGKFTIKAPASTKELVIEENVRPFDLVAQGGAEFHLRMDWWESRDGLDNSMWKCFAARMPADGTTKKMLNLCATVSASATEDNLFDLKGLESGRLGFDPRSSWDAADSGFSPNEHSTLKEAATYPYAELLTSIAAQTFPFGCGDAGNRRRGRYFTWPIFLPISLARWVAATGNGIRGTQEYAFERVMRGQGLSGLSYANAVVTIYGS